MSYQEWKEQQELGKEQMKYKLEHSERKAGEGENKSQWKNTKVFKRNENIDPLYTERRVKWILSYEVLYLKRYCNFCNFPILVYTYISFESMITWYLLSI